MTLQIFHAALLGTYVLYLFKQSISDVKTMTVHPIYDHAMLLLSFIYGICYSVSTGTLPIGLIPVLLIFGYSTKQKHFGYTDLEAILSMYFILNQNNLYFLAITFGMRILSIIMSIFFPITRKVPNADDKKVYLPYFPFITASFFLEVVLLKINHINFL